MPRLEEITYEAGRHALADQEQLVASIRHRTGTLLAAHALVASFLGAETLSSVGLTLGSWVALAALFVGLLLATVVLSSWNLRFAIDPGPLYETFRSLAETEARTETLSWMVEVGLSYGRLRDNNKPVVDRMSRLSTAFAVIVIAQTIGWMAALIGVR